MPTFRFLLKPPLDSSVSDVCIAPRGIYKLFVSSTYCTGMVAFTVSCVHGTSALVSRFCMVCQSIYGRTG